MNRFDRVKLLEDIRRKLNDSNVEIDEIDLNEVIEVYNKIFDFTYENIETTIGNIYGFSELPIELYQQDDYRFFDIFKSLIEMKKNNLLRFTDINFILFNCGHELFRDPIKSLTDYLNELLKLYKYDPETFIEELYNENTCMIEINMNNYLDLMLSSDYIDSDYKLLMQLFSDIFYKNDEIKDSEHYNDYPLDYYLNDYINAIYYYLVVNDLIKNDYDHVYKFLNNINNNLESTIDSIKLSGIQEDEDLFKFIDHAYKNINTKIKIIK